MIPSKRLVTAARSMCLVVGIVSATLRSDPAGAATLRLRGGAQMTVAQVDQAFLPGDLGSLNGALRGSLGGGIVYTLSEPSGSVTSGIIPGTRSVSIGEPSLAQNRVTGETFVAFEVRSSGGSQIAFSSWTGQSWTEPQSLTAGLGGNSEPALTFTETGEAVLAWRHEGRLPTILVRHFDLAPCGPVANHSFSDLGNPIDLVRPAGGPVGLASGIAHVVTDANSRHAYIFLSESESVGLVRLELEALLQGGGYFAPPVPVALSSPVPQSEDDAPQPVEERVGDSGSLIVPWRISLTADTVAYYWTESDRLALILFRHGVGGQLVAVPLPEREAEVHSTAYRVALRQIGLGERRGVERASQRRH